MTDKRRLTQVPHWPDARGWVGIGTFGVTIMILWMLKIDKGLRQDEFFQTIATMIITSGFLAVVAWAYGSTKTGGELADKNADIAHTVATNLSGDPQKVEVVPTAENPAVAVTETSPVTPAEELPPYARP